MGLLDFFKKEKTGYASKTFILQNKKIIITAKESEQDSTKVYTNKYHYVVVRNNKVEMTCKLPKEDFYREIIIQINYLENREIPFNSLGPFFDAFIAGCTAHIEKYGRLIVSDLWSEVNYTLWIVEAAKGHFHNQFSNENEWIAYREFLIKEGTNLLYDYIWIPHPHGLLDYKTGMCQIIKLSECQ